VGYLRMRGYPTMSHELIYQYVWNDKTLGGTLWKHLRLAAKRHITERSVKAEHRKEPGHWEIDTVVGRGTKHCIVTLVDRMTGYTFIGQMDNRTSESLNVRMSKIMTRSDL
ncbi:IS30 family transposase, partial [Vibrio anguillarum]|uniref:transposase n=1 Tax=Vibrio anguillarum TaxID=55601 RepID=UPI00399D6D78|nr:IS30 family transposase [Vibrio anguillarum]